MSFFVIYFHVFLCLARLLAVWKGYKGEGGDIVITDKYKNILRFHYTQTEHHYIIHIHIHKYIGTCKNGKIMRKDPLTDIVTPLHYTFTIMTSPLHMFI